MVNGFEDETEELNENGLKAGLVVLRGLKTKIGKENAVKNDSIRKGLSALGFNLSQARVRKIIHYLRVKGLIKRLVATSSGYYIENDDKLLANYVESLDQRISSIQEVRDSYSLPAREKL